ncbi:Acetolactate synthase small subunit [uncultured Ruminococcus sp.]|uniref:Acetolactate synthase small subunit n=1 Tax=Massiliimalia timonensis TaxID=1987501 RepID=A0A8J6TQD1_9FIRM|nr:acetolactate synthase small subunit [Massiliimalia timonensis]MBC8611019.1 acetolactate synthase small subunit [Massiliimalia timonensis]MBS7174672.1 acetolactate synthase small subunit [Clostridiales bacterium]SCH10732.1 Acetolactate synthase small subunit [uncultured Clostridium sp.]SCI50212.1 Acetolactate synthase small subunit [uncultured Ruminococcus sp.]
MLHTISILVENHAGTLSRISGLFSRRGFNIESLAVGITDDPTISRITIIVEGDDYTVEQVEKQLNKLVDVIKLKRIRSEENISRELMLVKVAYNAKTRGDVIDIARVMQSKICDISPSTITIEISDTTERLEILQELLKPYGILEVIRTGTIAIQKGSEVIN